MTSRINVDDLLADLEAFTSDFGDDGLVPSSVTEAPAPQVKPAPRLVPGPPPKTQFPSAFQSQPPPQPAHRYAAPVLTRTGSQVPVFVGGNPANDIGSIYSKRSEDDEEVAILKEQLERTKRELACQQELARQSSMTSHMSRSQSQTRQQLNRAPSMALSEASTSFSNDPNSQRNASISSRVSRSSLKSSTGWSGKASQRQSNKISDLIIDEACNLEHETIPMSVMATVIGMIREYYSTPTNKGAGANQAIMAVLFVCNLDDPAFVRKSMEVLDVLYHSCGPVFVLNLGLNLDFFQHFFETRKHRSPAERDNITFLCGLFAKWYSIQPTFEELALAGNLQDPTVKIRQFFEGLYRAGYDFPSHSLDHFPPDKLVAIKSSWMSSGVSFKRVKSQKGTPTPVPAEAPAMTRSQSALSRSSSGKNGPTKSPTGWSGRSSQRQAGKIADLIIDELCSLDYETAPLEATAAVIELVEEHYQQPKNKGAGANQVIMAIMYVCNLEDPAYVRRSLKVLDIMYKNCGPVFWINLSLNLDFYQHFLETRKHTTVQERDNIKYLCGIFAGWYLLEASKEELAVVAMTSDPSVKVKQFFEGLVRAGYEFPEGSLSRIPADKMASITTWSMMRGGFSFASVRK